MSGEERGKGEERKPEERGPEARSRQGEGGRHEPADGRSRLRLRPRPLRAQPLALRAAARGQQGGAAARPAAGKQQSAAQGGAPGKPPGAAGGRHPDGAGHHAGGAGGGPNQHDDIRQSLWVRRPDLFFGQPNQGGARAAFAEPPVPARQEVLEEAGTAEGQEGRRAPSGGERDARRDGRDPAGVVESHAGTELVQEVGGAPVPLTPEADTGSAAGAGWDTDSLPAAGSQAVAGARRAPAGASATRTIARRPLQAGEGDPGDGGARMEAATEPGPRRSPRLRLTTPLVPHDPRGGRAVRRPAGPAAQEGDRGGRKGSS